MKQIFVATIAAAVLLASCTTSNTTSNVTQTPEITSQIGTSDLAYVNMERVLSESEIFKGEGMKLQQRSETAQRDWSQQEQKLQSDAEQLQQKYQNGLITTANAQIEQQKIEQRVVAFQNTTQREMKELDEENTVFANRTQKLIRSAINNINEGKKYKMILNASALVDADSTLDISTIVLDEFNRLYKEEQKK